MSEPIKEFRVLTSGAFTAALVALTPSLESVLGKRVIAASTSIGIGESYIPTRLKRGEIADLVIVADDVLRDCVSDGLVLAAAYTPLVISLIGMAVRQSAPKPDISTVEAFKQTLLNAKSITYLKEGASTIHLRKLFVQLGVADATTMPFLDSPPAPPLAEAPDAVRRQLHQALTLLDQAPPATLASEPVDTQLQWAIAHWSPKRLTPHARRPTPEEP